MHLYMSHPFPSSSCYEIKAGYHRLISLQEMFLKSMILSSVFFGNILTRLIKCYSILKVIFIDALKAKKKKKLKKSYRKTHLLKILNGITRPVCWPFCFYIFNTFTSSLSPQMGDLFVHKNADFKDHFLDNFSTRVKIRDFTFYEPCPVHCRVATHNYFCICSVNMFAKHFPCSRHSPDHGKNTVVWKHCHREREGGEGITDSGC